MNLLEMTRDLVAAQIAQKNIDHASLALWLRTTHRTLLGLLVAEQLPRVGLPSMPVDWRSSIANKSITCLECGKVLRQLAPLHLKKHGLDAAGYRKRHGMPPSQPLSAKELTKRRREIMTAVRVWEKRHPGRSKAEGS